MAKTLSVSIVSEGDACRVIPGDSVASSGDTISFTNDTGAPVHIQFSENRLFEETITIPAGSDPVEVVIPESLRGWFPFAAFCEAINDFAVGGSMPIIIIIKN